MESKSDCNTIAHHTHTYTQVREDNSHKDHTQTIDKQIYRGKKKELK